jgi:hypothetical protein
MTMTLARVLIVIVGILLPFAARIPGGRPWLGQYTDGGIDGVGMIQAWNAMAWGSLLVLSFVGSRPATLLVPCVLGFGYLAWAHGTLDLAADAQAGIGVVFIPIYACVLIAIGAIVGSVIDRRRRRQGGG